MEYKIRKSNSPLTLEERITISHEILEGYSARAISKKIGRSPGCVSMEIKKNDGRKNYSPLQAHQYFLNRMKEKHETISKKQKGVEKPRHKIDNLITRLENLEFQIDILLEVIQELKNKTHRKND